MSDERRIFSPQSVEELLTGWLIHCYKARDRHDSSSRTYAIRQYALGIPALIVSTVVGTSVFAALSSKQVPPFWIGVLSIAAVVLTAVQTFMDFGGRSDKHQVAAVKYKAAIRNLEYLQVKLSNMEKLTEEHISAMRTQLDSLEEAAPMVMPNIYDRIELKYQNVKHVRKALDLYEK